MEALRKILVIIAVFVGIMPAWAGTWKTYFAYSSVTQIAETTDKIFALSDGSLFSIDKQTEEIIIYNSASGLHSTGIRYIFSDAATDKMVIMYTDGKMDILGTNGRFVYSSDLYNKQMIESKRVNSVSVDNGMAYMAMPFGILVYDLRKEEFSDTYIIGDSAKNVNVQDVVLRSDSIFAIGDSLTYAAARNADLRNYQSWRTELRSNRIVPDVNKGKVIVEANGTVWKAGGSNGVQCVRITGEQKDYLPNGPLNNNAYYLHCTANRLYMLNGGRWAAQYNREPSIMILENGTWTNITGGSIQRQIQNYGLTDLMEIAEDPNEDTHFFVSSYACGVVEFRNNQVVTHYMADNSTLRSCVPEFPNKYTRCSGITYAPNGDLYVLQSNDVPYRACIRKRDGNWEGINYSINNDVISCGTTGSIIIDNRNQNIKYWVSVRSSDVGLICSNDNGTPYDDTDDITIKRKTWVDQDSSSIDVVAIYHVYQTLNGNLWISTDQGLIMVPNTVDIFESNICYRLKFETPEGEEKKDVQINGVTQNIYDDVWVATNDLGVYVVSEDAQNTVAHYTSDNSLMPSNCVLSIAAHPTNDIVYVGTEGGVVSYSAEEETAIHNKDADGVEGLLGQWKLFPSYNNVSKVTCSYKQVFGLANGHLFSVDRFSREARSYNKIDGLSGSEVAQMQYDHATQQLVLYYENGMLDLVQGDRLYPLSDLYLKAENFDIKSNKICIYDEHLYMAMSFGIVDVNLRKHEVTDTYYIGHNAKNVNVLAVSSSVDSLFALSKDTLYSCSKGDNMVSFEHWHRQALHNIKQPSDIFYYHDKLYMLADSTLWFKENEQWRKVSDIRLTSACLNNDVLLAMSQKEMLQMDEADTLVHVASVSAQDAYYYQGEYWIASGGPYLISYQNEYMAYYSVNSPSNDYCYHLQHFGNKLYVAGGGRWANSYLRDATIKYYQDDTWGEISISYISSKAGIWVHDIMSFAVDPFDEKHFFAACYGNGLLEFRDNQLINRYGEHNSTLTSSASISPDYYTRVDAPVFDAQGNLYVLNMGKQGYSVNVLDVNGKWTGLNLYTTSNQRISLETACSNMLIDKRHSNWKWMAEARGGAGVILWDDNGTPINNSDDKALKRSSFVDQKGKPISIENIYCLAQDKNGVIWVGTNAGPILIDHENFFSSDKCSRVIIRRNDGTDLADYLLAEEQINAIAVDGGNRKWIGTAHSGIYLVSADGQETIHHFTAENSNLPSSEILSISINPETGDVFVGTAAGIASYRSDATEPKEDMSSVYAYPNPVRPDYVGEIAITGLMDESWVNIVDAGGNIVCKTRSHGGTATWDGCDQRGKRVASGVYSALCNAGDGSGHTVVKILIMNR